jgi:hypothetical protein
MSMMPPPFSAHPDDQGIPAADPGAGAPQPAPGFGIRGEEPDVVPAEDPQREEAEQAEAPPGDQAFRTPDPRE